MEGLIGVAYLLTGGALVMVGALLGGGLAKSMIEKKDDSEFSQNIRNGKSS